MNKAQEKMKDSVSPQLEIFAPIQKRLDALIKEANGHWFSSRSLTAKGYCPAESEFISWAPTDIRDLLSEVTILTNQLTKAEAVITAALELDDAYQPRNMINHLLSHYVIEEGTTID